jgi:hypothetical protein
LLEEVAAVGVTTAAEVALEAIVLQYRVNHLVAEHLQNRQ